MIEEYDGFSVEEIEEAAQQLFQAVVELGIPNRLAVLALCRTIAIVGDEDDLDTACRFIDAFSEEEEVDEDSEF